MELKKGLTIFGILVKTSFMHALQYRAQFVAAFISAGLEVLLYMVFLQSIFRQTSSIGGWTNREVLLLFGLSTMAIALIKCFVTPNLRYMTSLIRKGELDFVLVKPFDSQFLVSLKNYNFFALAQFIQGLLIVIFTGIIPNLPGIFLTIWVMVMGIVIVYSIWFTVLLIVFKTYMVDNAIAAIDISLTFVRYPISVYPRLVQTALTYVIPLIFVAHVPAQMLIGKVDVRLLILSTVLAIVLFAFSRFMWKFAIRHYSSASS